MKPAVRRILAAWPLLFLLLAMAGGVVGCASTETDNASSRPWNTPKGWETGLPSGMYERGR
jgi:hypothetical protein